MQQVTFLVAGVLQTTPLLVQEGVAAGAQAPQATGCLHCSALVISGKSLSVSVLFLVAALLSQCVSPVVAINIISHIVHPAC